MAGTILFSTGGAYVGGGIIVATAGGGAPVVIPAWLVGTGIGFVVGGAADLVGMAGDALINALPSWTPPDIVLNSRAGEGSDFVVDGKGNAIPLAEGEYITGSPDGRWIQVRGPDGEPTGVRIDGGHPPRTHPDPSAQVPHGTFQGGQLRTVNHGYR